MPLKRRTHKCVSCLSTVSRAQFRPPSSFCLLSSPLLRRVHSCRSLPYIPVFDSPPSAPSPSLPSPRTGSPRRSALAEAPSAGLALPPLKHCSRPGVDFSQGGEGGGKRGGGGDGQRRESVALGVCALCAFVVSSVRPLLLLLLLLLLLGTRQCKPKEGQFRGWLSCQIG
jgi:hypothetical protein